MKALGITLGLAVLIAVSSTAMAASQEVYALPMGDYKVQFDYGGTINFGIYGGRGAMEMISPGDTHPSDANSNASGKWNGTPLADIQQIEFGHMDMGDGAAGKELAYIFMVDWNFDNDNDPTTGWGNAGGQPHMRLLPQMAYTAYTHGAGSNTATTWNTDPNTGGMALNQWYDIVVSRQLQCWEFSNTSAAFAIDNGTVGMWQPGDDPTTDSNARFMSLEQMEQIAPNAYFCGQVLSAWPTPETLEIAAGWYGSGAHFAIDYLNIYYGGQQVLGDANGDMAIDVGDLGILSSGWGSSVGPTTATSDLECKADFNGDTVIEVGDLAILSANWGSTAFASWTLDATNFTNAAGGSSLDAAGVPLPSAFGAGLVLMGLAARRRR